MITKIHEPPDVEVPSTSDICLVCGGFPAALHYGAVTCCSCKVFFLRTAGQTRGFMCEKSSRCEIPADRCRACRFRRCLEAGMIPESVGARKKLKVSPASNARTDEILPDLAVVPYYSGPSVKQIRSLSKDIENAECASALAQYLLRVERLCNNPDGSYASSVDFNYSISIDLPTALKEPATVCDRTPIGFTGDLKVARRSTKDIFLQLYCRMTTHVLDWVVAKNEFWELCDADRVISNSRTRFQLRLLRKQSGAVLVFTFCFYSYWHNAEGLILCHGFQYKKQETTDFSTLMIEYAHNNIISVFKEEDLSQEEYAILKTIIFFGAVDNFTENGARTLRRARRKFEQFLYKISDEQQAHLSASARARRLARIVGVIPHIIKMSHLNENYLTRLVALNMESMKGKLTTDFHLSE